MKKLNYRKIYENVYGPIPLDQHGRSYEIHHIDGNRNNNSIENLLCVTINEHYAIHFAQKDWAACYAIKIRIGADPSELRKLASKREKEKLINGTHNFQNIELLRETNRRRLADGTHNILTLNANRVSNGTHNFLGASTQKNKYLRGEHPTQIILSCIYCRSESTLHSFNRLHGDNCDCNPSSETFKMNKTFPGERWWNNGIEEQRSKTCPGIDWVLGTLVKKSNGTPPSPIGKKRWNNGIEERLAFECPGPEWTRGGKKRKSNG